MVVFVVSKTRKFVKMLYNIGFVDRKFNNSKKCDLYFMEFDDKINFPLTSLNIELTNNCNLNCIHCYGSYGKPEKIYYFNYNNYLKLKNDFEKLNVKNISITGGECTVNKDFFKIAEDVVKSGFNLWILTNSLNTDVIKKFVVNNKNFHFGIKVSLNGFEYEHNYIRGNVNSYNSVIDLLDFLKEFKNIKVCISTVLMKSNIDNYYNFKNFIYSKYPNFIHTFDFVFPSGQALIKNNTFSLKEISEINKKNFILRVPNNDAADIGFRCTGGITQCTIESDGNVKICNAANDDRFRFEYNVMEHDLKKVWEDCGINIRYFRQEKNKNNSTCLSCDYSSNCKSTNCRLMSFFYKGSEFGNSPLTCMLTKGDL